MRKLLPIVMIPILASCLTLQSPKGAEASEVITADLTRADGSWAGVATAKRLPLEHMACISMLSVNAKHLTSPAPDRTGTRI